MNSRERVLARLEGRRYLGLNDAANRPLVFAHRGARGSWRRCAPGLALVFILLGGVVHLYAAGRGVFDVKRHGATGKKTDDARPAIQKAMDACAAAGGGVVKFPPGEYTSGTLHLRSRVRVELEAGATLFASPDPKAYEFGNIPSKAALFFGEDLEDISIGGEGTVDGQAEYEWRLDDFERAFDHKTLMESLGKPLVRSFPKDFRRREVFPHLVWLGRSKNVRVTGLRFQRSPGWTLALYGCERAVFDGLQIHSSLKEAVWADGIDLDGCREVVISNCTIATGDDCIAFISTDVWGPALVCENITVSRCRLSSASAGVKFSEGNRAGIRGVRVLQTVLTNVNRGFVFSTTLGGDISDVVLSDLTIDCNRFDWFWAGDGQPFRFRITRLSEFNQEPAQPGELPPGTIRNVTIRNVRAHAKGSSLIHGHAERWLDHIHFENVRLTMATDPAAPFDQAEHAFQFRWAKNVTVKNVEVSWEKPTLAAWRSALSFADVSELVLEGFNGSGAWPDPVVPVVFNQVRDALIRESRTPGAATAFLQIIGQESRDIRLQGNDFGKARIPYRLEPGVRTNAVKVLERTVAE